MPEGYYRVKAGDTLNEVALAFKIDSARLALWNDLTPPYRIVSGRLLRVAPPTEGLAAPRVAGAQEGGGKAKGRPARAPVVKDAAGPARSEMPPKLVKQAKPAEPVKPVKQAKPVEPVKPVEQAKPVEPVKSIKQAKPTEPAKPVEQVKPVEQAKPAEPVKPVEQAKPAKESPKVAEVRPSAAEAKSKKADSKADSDVGGGAALRWHWPLQGPVRQTFAPGDRTRSGIRIAGRSGDQVRAAEAGTVVYSGSGLKGYGNLIIIQHNKDYLSAYGFNRRLLVQEGARVKRGQTVAEIGQATGGEWLLHFEIRKDGNAVDPLGHLPSTR